MTHLGTIIILLVCVAVGYFMEPMFFSGVTRKPAPVAQKETPAQPAVDQPGDPEPEPEVQLDLSKITQADFPEKVSLKVPYTISDANSGVTMQLKQGIKVKPVRLEGSQLVIQPVGLPIEGKIDVDKTDFKALAAPKMLARLNNPEPNPEPTPEPTPEPEPEPMPEPEPEPEPEPTPEPTPDPEVANLDEAAVVALMKKDVAAGNVTEFKANQVTAWKAGEAMEFDGETYQTGRVTFKAETILGVQEHEAIALIEDGKVYKWMWAKTKLEMR